MPSRGVKVNCTLSYYSAVCIMVVNISSGNGPVMDGSVKESSFRLDVRIAVVLSILRLLVGSLSIEELTPVAVYPL